MTQPSLDTERAEDCASMEPTEQSTTSGAGAAVFPGLNALLSLSIGPKSPAALAWTEAGPSETGTEMPAILQEAFRIALRE